MAMEEIREIYFRQMKTAKREPSPSSSNRVRTHVQKHKQNYFELNDINYRKVYLLQYKQHSTLPV